MAAYPTIEAAVRTQYPPPTDGSKPRRRWGLGAFKKGWQAAANGELPQDCPYKDTRTWRGSVTFARGYIKAWQRGYQMYHQQQINYNPKGYLP